MTTSATPAPVSPLDTVLAKIDALGAAPATATSIEVTAEKLTAHALDQLEKAAADELAGKSEQKKARLEHLKAQVTAAKAVFAGGATTAKIETFTADIPQPAITPTGDSNIKFENDVIFTTKADGSRELTDLFKSLFKVAKATEAAPARAKLAKSEDGKTTIAKAGEALACLSKIAAIFNYVPEEGSDLLDCDFRWSVSDTVSALQAAARTEHVIAQMSGLLGEATAKAALVGKAIPAAAPPAAPAPSPAPAPRETAWPMDMASADFDEKAGIYKNKGTTGDEEPFWGRDSGKAPTT